MHPGESGECAKRRPITIRRRIRDRRRDGRRIREEHARYCPLCGSELAARQIEGRRRSACPSCPYVLYRNPGCGAAAVVLRGREVLLIRRGVEPFAGHWGVPAGYQEYGELLEDCATRETLEETGVEIEITGLLELSYNRDDPRKECNIAFFEARARGGELRPRSDAVEVRWFALDALPDKIAFESNRRILDTLRRKFALGTSTEETGQEPR